MQRRSKKPADQKKFDAEWERIFGKKRPNEDADDLGRVRYRPDPKTGRLIPDYMWAQYDMAPPEPPKGHFVWADYSDYASSITGERISGRRAHRNHLKKHGIRVYEGREQESKEAARHRAYEEKKFSQTLEKSMAKTLNDMRYQNNAPVERDRHGRPKVSWTFGE